MSAAEKRAARVAAKLAEKDAAAPDSATGEEAGAAAAASSSSHHDPNMVEARERMARRKSIQLGVDQRGWNPTLRDYTSTLELEAWLNKLGVRTSTWTGKHAGSDPHAVPTRTVEELFNEIVHGESEVSAQGQSRVLRQVCIFEV